MLFYHRFFDILHFLRKKTKKSSMSGVCFNNRCQDIEETTMPQEHATYELNHQVELNHTLHQDNSNSTNVMNISSGETSSDIYNFSIETVHTNHILLQDEAAASVEFINPIFKNEMQRLISYADDISFTIKSFLAKNGLYYKETNIAQCYFCMTRIEICSADIPQSPHICKKQGNVELPQHTYDYRYECNRLLSLLQVDWNKNVQGGKFPVGALDLAHWGFYYIGEPDAVRCVFCRLEVRGWEVGDSAESEHRRWNPHCPFICGRTVGNIRLGEELITSQVVSDNVVVCSGIPNSGNEELGITKVITPKHEKFRSLASRINTYDTWPRSLKQRPQELSEAGFFYTGTGDRVVCYQCGQGLKDWSSYDPWVEHALWAPHCVHVNLHKGAKFIRQVQNREITADSKSIAQPHGSTYNNGAIKKVPTPTSAADKLCVDEVHDSCRQCRICSDNEVTSVFLPCGHMAACISCASKAEYCPMCHAKIAAYIKAFLP